MRYLSVSSHQSLHPQVARLVGLIQEENISAGGLVLPRYVNYCTNINNMAWGVEGGGRGAAGALLNMLCSCAAGLWDSGPASDKMRWICDSVLDSSKNRNPVPDNKHNMY